jgi:hypothetical protein
MVGSRHVKAAKEPCCGIARQARRQSRGRQGRKDLERLPHARATHGSRAPCSSRTLGEGEEEEGYMKDDKPKKPKEHGLTYNPKSTEGMPHKQHKQRPTQLPRQVRTPRKSG